MTTIIFRNCRGCKTTKNREELIRITLNKGELFINPNSKIVGRSVYVCKNPECIKKLIKTKGIARHLKFNNSLKIKQVEDALIKYEK